MADCQHYMTTKSNLNVGYRFRQERVRCGYTQSEMASKIGVATRTIGRWEKGEPIPSDKLLDCVSLDIDVHKVLFETNVTDSKEPYMAVSKQVDVELLTAVIKRVEELIARPSLQNRVFTTNDKSRAIAALYKSFSETETPPVQFDPAVLSTLELLAG